MSSLGSRVVSSCGAMSGGIIFLLVGVGMLGFGGWSFMNTRNQMNTWGNVTGEVIDLSHYSDSDGGTLTVPVIRFTTVGGEVVTAEPYQERNTTVDVDGYHVGDEVEVFYDPENPRDMFINDFMHVWFVPSLMGGLGGLFGLIGLIWAGAVLMGAVFVRRPTVAAQPMMSGPPTINI